VAADGCPDPSWVEIPEDSPGVIAAKRRCGVL
jgi:hypothetical protein